ncbi:glycosaminoglycan xylosylkinase isoform X2 [Cryptotermes secundus]|uniref:glycosaminoglycan xylosylkinase isoform X2 n=1 Tax=Cryptotermes secundus TaxID=105785 RepID=UPI000CD7AEAC|nr:glycosaminoglycan xylosylkinase isoform X2 [Cryptotermes secundus]
MRIFNIIRRTILSLTALFVLVLTANVYFVYVIVEERSPSIQTNSEVVVSHEDKNVGAPAVRKKVSKPKQTPVYRNATLSATQRIKQKLLELSSNYHKVSLTYKQIVSQLLDDLKLSMEMSTELWGTARKWVGPREIVPKRAPHLGSVLRTLCSTKIIRAENAQHQGTQLKLMLTLLGNQKAVFKPQWYSRSKVIGGPVYAGKDRHNAEVAAFHLSILLGLRRSPLTVGRKVNLRREVMPVATNDLLETFYQEGNNTCFYGVCYFCGPNQPVCAQKDVMEGALVLWLPSKYKLKKHRSPWQRTYKSHTVARWEVDDDYCMRVKAMKLYDPNTGPRLLDLIDAAIFDFLIDNGDRHHYDVFENVTNSMVLLLDNGKGFGNPHRDHLDILAPLYQCCVLRKSTWDRLQLFSGNALSTSLEALLHHSHIAPVLTSLHLKALDRRLLFVFATVEMCFEQHGRKKVLVYDAVR